MTKFFLKLFAIILLLLTAGIITTLYLLNSTAGTKLVLYVAKHQLPGQLTVTGVHGGLGQHVTIRELQYRENEQLVTAKKIHLSLNLKALFKKRLHVQAFSIANIHLDNSKQQLNFEQLKVTGKFDPVHLDSDLQLQLTSHLPTKAHISTSGTWDKYQLEAKIDNALSSWHFIAKGNRDTMTLATIDNKLLSGSLNINGHLTWAPTLNWQATIEAQGLETNQLMPSLPPALNFTLNANTLTSQQTVVDLKINSQLNADTHLSTHIKAAINEVKTGANHGYTITSQPQEVALPTVASATGPAIKKTKNMAKSDQQINTHRLTETNKTPETLTLPDTTITATAFPYHVDGVIESLTIKNQAIGAVNNKQPAKFYYKDQKLSLPSLCLLQYQTKKKLSPISPELCVSAHYQSAENFKVSINSSDLPLSLLRLYTQTDLVINGRAKLSATITATDNHPLQAKVELLVSRGELQVPYDNKQQTLPFKGGWVHANIRPDSATADIDLQFVEKSMLRGHFNLPKFKLDAVTSQQPIAGQIHWQFPNIAFIAAFTPEISALTGAADINFNIDGTLAEPRLLGSASIEKGQFFVRKLNTGFDQFTLSAKGDGKALRYQADTRAGPGHLTIQGKTDLNQVGFPTEVRVSGDNAEVYHTSEIHVRASPDLTIHYRDNALDLSGKILIPFANITPTDFSRTEKLEDDIIIVEQEAKKNEPNDQPSPLAISSDIGLTLGKGVSLKAMGVTGKLSGFLNIHDKANQPTTAQGQLSMIGGNYDMHGTKLAIPNGKFIFTGGPITNPGLDIRAMRSFSQRGSYGASHFNAPPLSAGIHITGTLQKPLINLYSDPAGRNNSDILSLILTGQGINQLSENKAGLLLQAASALDFGGGGDNKITTLRNDVKNQLGLSTLDIEADSEYDKKSNKMVQHTSLVLGKYLSPKLYVKTSFDIMEHTPTINIRYTLGKNWSIQTEHTMSGSGVDLLYTVERK